MLKVRDVLTADVVTLDADLDVRTAMEELSRRRISGAPVVTEGAVVGVLTTADLMEFVASMSRDAAAGSEEPRPETGDEEEDPREEWNGLPGWAAPSGAPSYFALEWNGLPESGGDMGEFEPKWDQMSVHPIREAMTPEVWSISPETDVESAAAEMQRRGVHRLLVMEDGELKGIVSTTDIARAVAEHRITHRTWVFSPHIIG